jgi:hypothetical protein
LISSSLHHGFLHILHEFSFVKPYLIRRFVFRFEFIKCHVFHILSVPWIEEFLVIWNIISVRPTTNCPSNTASIKICNMENWPWSSARWLPYHGSLEGIIVVKCPGELWHCGWSFRYSSWIWPETSRMGHFESISHLTKQMCAHFMHRWLAVTRRFVIAASFNIKHPIFLTVHQDLLMNLDVDQWPIWRPAVSSIYFCISCHTNIYPRRRQVVIRRKFMSPIVTG